MSEKFLPQIWIEKKESFIDPEVEKLIEYIVSWTKLILAGIYVPEFMNRYTSLISLLTEKWFQPKSKDFYRLVITTLYENDINTWKTPEEVYGELVPIRNLMIKRVKEFVNTYLNQNLW